MAVVREFRISDTLREWLLPCLPVHMPSAHLLGYHRWRALDRQVLDDNLFVLRTGRQ